jgi:hypothetical protein
MSRTYRKHLVPEYKVDGIIYNDKNVFDISRKYHGCWYFGGHYQVVRKNRDKKPWYKPNKQFKQMNRRCERSNVKNAIRFGKEVLPIFKKTDNWEWT